MAALKFPFGGLEKLSCSLSKQSEEMEEGVRRVCDLCGESFNRTAYYRHRNKQTCQKEKTKSFETRMRNKRESERRQGIEPHNAAVCGEQFYNEEQQDLFVCPEEECGFSYTSFLSLQGHYRFVHKGTLSSQASSYSIDCGCCELSFPTIRMLCYHVQQSEDHWDVEGQYSSAPYCVSTANFGSIEEFLDWKEKIESQTDAEFIRKGRFRGKWWTTDSFYCSRSGRSVKCCEDEEMAARPGKRAPRRLPSKKIGYHCTSFIQSRKLDDGLVCSIPR
ncbi:MAG: hypothetical protein GY820_18730 [Gammaproteobacteria bacterium]|nr:hypothetical protein [Gammaproteobacteria bacterium]